MSRRTRFVGSYEEVEEIAELVKETFGAKGETGNGDVSEWLRATVRALGGEVKVAENPSDQESGGGSLVIYRKDNFVIWLSPYTSLLRDNFTMAHELGHYFLHYDSDEPDDERPVIFYRYSSGPDEWQANRFAAALLMPAQEFRKVHKKLRGNTGLLAGHFQVSEPAVSVRANYILDEK